MKKTVLKLFLLLAALGLLLWACGAAGVWTGEDLSLRLDLSLAAFLKLGSMVVGVILLVTVLKLLLGLFKPRTHRGQTLRSLVYSLIQYAAALTILCWGLSILGVNVSAIVASVGVLALIVGFGAESLIADVVTGVFMLFENQCNVGDIVEVGGFRGTIQKIGIRTTCVVDSGDNVKIINNSEMKNILNRSDNASRAVCDMDIPYETDLEALEAKLPELLEKIGKDHADVLRSAPQYVGVQSLEASSVRLRFVVPVAEENIFSAQRLLNRELLLGFRRLGVECPFAQLDVHSR